MITWASYTCARTGETFAAKRSLHEGDIYNLETQYNSRLRKETTPKHGSVGTLYVPPPAQEAVARLPARLGDDLLWRTVTGKQFKQSSWSPTWQIIRQVFMRELPRGHHLHQRLALDRTDVFDFYELRHFGACIHAQRPGDRTMGHREAASPQGRWWSRRATLRPPDH